MRLFVEEVAQGMAAGRGIEQVGGHLVQEWLKRVVIVLVDERDVDGGILELAGGADASEAAPEHQQVGTPGVRAVGAVRCPAAGR